MVAIENIEKGPNAVIGQLDTTTVVCVDDDIYPSKIERTPRYPRDVKEDTIPSCVNSDMYLTSTETPDFSLIRQFIVERWMHLWPYSGWGGLWSVYRGFYRVALSILLVIFIDCVYIEPETEMPASTGCAHLEHHERLLLGAGLSIMFLIATYVQSCTETWVAENAKVVA